MIDFKMWCRIESSIKYSHKNVLQKKKNIKNREHNKCVRF